MGFSLPVPPPPTPFLRQLSILQILSSDVPPGSLPSPLLPMPALLCSEPAQWHLTHRIMQAVCFHPPLGCELHRGKPCLPQNLAPGSCLTHVCRKNRRDTNGDTPAKPQIERPPCPGASYPGAFSLAPLPPILLTLPVPSTHTHTAPERSESAFLGRTLNQSRSQEVVGPQEFKEEDETLQRCEQG